VDERVIWVYVIEVLEGLAALHAAGIVHGGVSPPEQGACVVLQSDTRQSPPVRSQKSSRVTSCLGRMVT
jgi:serine/threonine protein kinase